MAHCIEVVVYRVKNAETAEAARREMRAHLENYPGFLDWTAATSLDDPTLFTDIVTWASLSQARDASGKVMSDPGCAPLMAEVAELITMGHYG